MLIESIKSMTDIRRGVGKTEGGTTDSVQPCLIQERMEKPITGFHNGKEHIITRLARFRIEFESIHPFIDGNGRTGRLLANLELMKAGYPPIDIKFKDRKACYDAFDAYDINALEKLFVGYVCERLDRYLSILQEEDGIMQKRFPDTKVA